MPLSNRNLRITNKNLTLTTLSNGVRLKVSKDIRQNGRKEKKEESSNRCYQCLRGKNDSCGNMRRELFIYYGSI